MRCSRYTRIPTTEIGGFVAESRHKDLELVPTLFAGAIPAGLVDRAALDYLTEAIVARARQRDFDGVLFAIHGAMVADGIDEADAYTLQRIRNAIGIDTPLVVTFDLHGNISEALVEVADVLVGYGTLPHFTWRSAVERRRGFFAGCSMALRGHARSSANCRC